MVWAKLTHLQELLGVSLEDAQVRGWDASATQRCWSARATWGSGGLLGWPMEGPMMHFKKDDDWKAFIVQAWGAQGCAVSPSQCLPASVGPQCHVARIFGTTAGKVAAESGCSTLPLTPPHHPLLCAPQASIVRQPRLFGTCKGLLLSHLQGLATEPKLPSGCRPPHLLCPPHLRAAGHRCAAATPDWHLQGRPQPTAGGAAVDLQVGPIGRMGKDVQDFPIILPMPSPCPTNAWD